MTGKNIVLMLTVDPETGTPFCAKVLEFDDAVDPFEARKCALEVSALAPEIRFTSEAWIRTPNNDLMFVGALEMQFGVLLSDAKAALHSAGLTKESLKTLTVAEAVKLTGAKMPAGFIEEFGNKLVGEI